MEIIGIIPARYESTRFPGKPLVMIHGKTMIRRVYEQALKSEVFGCLAVATDHEAILDHVLGFGGRVVMTGTHHGSGTERCYEAAGLLKQDGVHFDAVINIQGDEPYIDPGQISTLAESLIHSPFPIATLVKKITDEADLDDPNVVKVVVGESGQALYFSRAAIPYCRGAEKSAWLAGREYYKHVGIYGYRSGILDQIVSLPPAFPEEAESLEQLRWLCHGFQIQTRVTEFESISIDTPADLLKIPAGT